MHLCAACREIRPFLYNNSVDDNAPLHRYIDHHTSSDHLRKAWNDGCLICKKLWPKLITGMNVAELDGLRPATFCLATSYHDSGPRAMEDAKIVFYRRGILPNETVMVSIHAFSCIALARSASPHAQLGLQQKQSVETTARPLSQEIHLSTDSAHTIQLAKTWLQRCDGHSNCNRDRVLGWYPDRLLHLRRDDPDPVLITKGDTKADIGNGRYATLSHCWGSTPTVRLLSENWKQFRRGIDVASLPATFRDAIALCRKFDIDYLWIDSLCIQQDDALDWRFQSAQMQKIYQHSEVNLSASGAGDGTQGCFFERDPDDVWPLPLCPLFRNYDWTRDLRAHEEHQYYIVDNEFWLDMCAESPVFHRAWIFQERLLARRVLHMGKTQLYWECRSANYCETFPDGLPSQLQPSESFLSKSLYYQMKSGESGGLTLSGRWHMDVAHVRQEKRIRYWETLITHYTRCKLTMARDKLVALSGIAMNWNGATKGTYLAGMWKAHLPHALLWTCSTRAVAPSKYRAPTWSWASVNGTIAWDDMRWSHRYVYTASVLDSRMEYVGNEWGEIKGGYILIRGPVIRLIVSHASHHEICVQPWENNQARTVASLVSLDTRTSGSQRIFTSTELYALLIVHYNDTTVEGPRALVLAPVFDQPEFFRRIGVMCSRKSSNVQEWFHAAEEQDVFVV